MPRGIFVYPRALEGSRAILRVKGFCILPWISRPNNGYLWVSGQVSEGGTGIEGLPHPPFLGVRVQVSASLRYPLKTPASWKS